MPVALFPQGRLTSTRWMRSIFVIQDASGSSATRSFLHLLTNSKKPRTGRWSCQEDLRPGSNRRPHDVTMCWQPHILQLSTYSHVEVKGGQQVLGLVPSISRTNTQNIQGAAKKTLSPLKKRDGVHSNLSTLSLNSQLLLIHHLSSMLTHTCACQSALLNLLYQTNHSDNGLS